MFVIPAVIIGFLAAVPTLNGVYRFLFTKDMGVDTSPRPSNFAIA